VIVWLDVIARTPSRFRNGAVATRRRSLRLPLSVRMVQSQEDDGVLEIVERILAALIILALLTLLIILAFPVPPRQPAGPSNTAQKPADTPTETRPAPAAPPKVEPAKKDPPAPVQTPPADKTQEAQAKDPRPAADPKIDSKGVANSEKAADNSAEDKRRHNDGVDTATRKTVPPAPLREHAADVRPCSDADCRRRARHADSKVCNEEGCRRRPPPAVVARDCSSRGCGDCDDRRRGVRSHNAPYWAQPRRYASREDDPDWYDEREFDPGPPPGVCPD
jgi:hypothetical protein